MFDKGCQRACRRTNNRGNVQFLDNSMGSIHERMVKTEPSSVAPCDDLQFGARPIVMLHMVHDALDLLFNFIHHPRLVRADFKTELCVCRYRAEIRTALYLAKYNMGFGFLRDGYVQNVCDDAVEGMGQETLSFYGGCVERLQFGIGGAWVLILVGVVLGIIGIVILLSKRN